MDRYFTDYRFRAAAEPEIDTLSTCYIRYSETFTRVLFLHDIFTLTPVWLHVCRPDDSPHGNFCLLLVSVSDLQRGDVTCGSDPLLFWPAAVLTRCCSDPLRFWPAAVLTRCSHFFPEHIQQLELDLTCSSLSLTCTLLLTNNKTTASVKVCKYIFISCRTNNKRYKSESWTLKTREQFRKSEMKRTISPVNRYSACLHHNVNIKHGTSWQASTSGTTSGTLKTECKLFFPQNWRTSRTSRTFGRWRLEEDRRHL